MKRTVPQLPWIIPERCEGCADCVGVCPRGCLSMHDTGREGVQVPWVDVVDACGGCGLCAESCVWGAISMTAHVFDARRRLEIRKPAAATNLAAGG